MNTSDLIKVMKDNTKINKVSLGIARDASEFWAALSTKFYHELPDYDETMIPNCRELDMRTDLKIKHVMESFAQIDSLELVNKQGRIIKRFAKYFKQETGYKFSDELAGKLGDSLQYFVNQAAQDFFLDFTNDFNWNDGQFGHHGSCWWGTYKDSLPTFQNGGGWAIRFYEDMNQNNINGCGRTWIFPKDGMLMCFNSYGVSRPQTSKVIKSIYKDAGIVLHYKAVELENSQNDTIPYINSGTGFILFPDGINESELDDRYDLDIETTEDERYSCYGCGCRIDEGEEFYTNGETWCESCHSNRFSYCEKCDEYHDSDDIHEVHGHSSYNYLCGYCISQLHYCEECEEYSTDEHDHSEDESNESNESSDEVQDESEYDFITGQLESVQYKNGYGVQDNTTMVYRHSQADGLYLSLNSGDVWSITHESSGLSVSGNIPSDDKVKAFELLNRLASIADWNVPDYQITTNRELCQLVMSIRQDVIGR